MPINWEYRNYSNYSRNIFEKIFDESGENQFLFYFLNSLLTSLEIFVLRAVKLQRIFETNIVFSSRLTEVEMRNGYLKIINASTVLFTVSHFVKLWACQRKMFRDTKSMVYQSLL